MSDRRVIQLPAVFDAANRKKDRSLSLRLTTSQEVSNEDFAIIDRSVGRAGWLLFAENPFDDPDVPKEAAPTDRGYKTPSQRLRAVLFVKWKAEGSRGEFDDYYRAELNYIIESYKELLPEVGG